MTSTTQRLTRELIDFLAPVQLGLGSAAGLRRLLHRLGHAPSDPALVQAVVAMSNTYEALTTVVRVVDTKTWAGEPLTDDDYTTIASQLPASLAEVQRLPATLPELGADFASELVDLLVVDYFRLRAPVLLRALVLIGVVEIELGTPERYAVRWDRLREFLTDPAALMGELYGWGGAQFAAGSLLANVGALLAELGVVALPSAAPVGVAGVSGEGLDVVLRQLLGGDRGDRDLGVVVLPVGDGVAISPYLRGVFDEEVPVGGTAWRLLVHGPTAAAGELVMQLSPTGVTIDTDASLRLELTQRRDEGAPIVLLGDGSGSRIEADGLTVAGGVGPDEPYLAVAASSVRLIVDASGDGLFGSLLGVPVTADAGDVVAGWRFGRGIYVEAGSGLGVRIPLDVRVAGVLQLREIALRVALEPDTSFSALLTADMSVGPMTLGFTDLGITATLAANPQGSFGAFDLDMRVVHPNGYLVNLASGPLTGGGALIRRGHEYAGTLLLRFEMTSFSALGILNTRLPDGQEGFSFLAAIFSEFEIPLGSGFFLTGLGGVVGINRCADSAALRDLVANGTLDDILFPADPIAAAPRVLTSLAGVFPQRPGTHVFGPVARLRFGNPALAVGKIGFVVEVGDRPRVLVVGLISSDLPSADNAVVSLRGSFFGELDLAAGTISIDASLDPGSQVLDFQLSGDMAVRTGWGARVDHVFAFGGLHPAYPRPANLPELSRLSINFGGNNPRVTLSAYLAVTTNSLQFGAEASLYAKGPKIPLVGRLAAEGQVSFHALVYFDPFAFEATLGGGLTLLVDGEVILGLGFDLRLSGPNPFRVAGRVWATVAGIDVGFPIEHSWGTSRPIAAPIVDPIELLRAGLESGAGLEPIGSSARVSGVTFGPADAGPRVVDPAAGLRYLQREIPLGRSIDKVGEAALAGGPHRYDLVGFDGVGGELALDPAVTDFVRGHFWRLPEAERLRAPAFEQATGGFVFGGADLVVNASASIDADHGYEVIDLDATEPEGFPAEVLGEVALAWWSQIHRRKVASPLRPQIAAGTDSVSMLTAGGTDGLMAYVAVAAGPD
jgi:hypothetical protein